VIGLGPSPIDARIVPRDLTEQVLTRVSPEPQLNDRHQSRCRKLAPATVQPSLSRLWMGFDTDVTMGLASGTNATQLRVAAGVLSGWSQLGRHKLIHFVEDLNNHEFVSIATEILGRPLVVHDESAPARLLSDRVRTTVGTFG
jgi:hypothetical protein